MRRLKRKYKRPKRPWDTKRIEEEKQLMSKFGLRRKKEIWRAEEILRNFRRRARSLIAKKDENEIKILTDKLIQLGLLQKGCGLEDILSLTVSDILNRRLQTIVHKKGLAKTIKEARQKIVHGHIYVNGRKNIFPSYLVPIDKENKIEVKE